MYVQQRYGDAKMAQLEQFRIVSQGNEYLLTKYETREYIRTNFGEDFDATMDLLAEIGQRLGQKIDFDVDWITEEDTTMVDIDAKRKHIQDWLEDWQTSDNYQIGRAEINWLRNREEWQLILPNGEIVYDNYVGSLIDLIDDADIEDYYPSIQEYFEEVVE